MDAFSFLLSRPLTYRAAYPASKPVSRPYAPPIHPQQSGNYTAKQRHIPRGNSLIWSLLRYVLLACMFTQLTLRTSYGFLPLILRLFLRLILRLFLRFFLRLFLRLFLSGSIKFSRQWNISSIFLCYFVVFSSSRKATLQCADCALDVVQVKHCSRPLKYNCFLAGLYTAVWEVALLTRAQ